MEFKRSGHNRLRVGLTGEELAEIGLDYDHIDYQCSETQKLILSLLGTARITTGFVPGDQLVIEVYPAKEGGCIFYFTGPNSGRPQRWKVLHKHTSPVIYAFEDIDLLIACSVQLFKRASHRIRKSSLYRVKEGYRLILYPLDLAQSVTLPLMDEYARRCGEGELAAAALREHGNVMVEESAIDLISAYFG